MSRTKQVAIALDQLANTLLGGYADETMSTRCWRLREFRPYSWLRLLIDCVFWFTPNHCEESYKNRMAYLPRNIENESKP